MSHDPVRMITAAYRCIADQYSLNGDIEQEGNALVFEGHDDDGTQWHFATQLADPVSGAPETGEARVRESELPDEPRYGFDEDPEGLSLHLETAAGYDSGSEHHVDTATATQIPQEEGALITALQDAYRSTIKKEE